MLVDGCLMHIDHHADEHKPENQCRGYTAANNAQCGETPLAVDQQVVDWNVDQEADKAEPHGGQCVGESFTVVT